MKHIRIFETAELAAAILPTLEYSTLSKIRGERGVSLNLKVVPPTPTHDYVEIGGIKWATVNVGAENPEDEGLWFAWKESEGWTYAQVQANERSFEAGPGLNDFNYNMCNDSITLIWGESWRMPTHDEFQSLIDNTNLTTETINGKQCSVYTDKNNINKRIIIPNVGSISGKSKDTFYGGCLWASDGTNGSRPYRLFTANSLDTSAPYLGMQLRGVLDDAA